MNDRLQKIIEEMRSKLYPLHGQTDDGCIIVTSAEIESWASRLSALQGEPVAWMHEDPKRVDVIHAKVKDLLKSAGEFHRPLDKSEKYTIPLYAAPQQGDVVLTRERGLLREALAWIESGQEPAVSLCADIRKVLAAAEVKDGRRS